MNLIESQSLHCSLYSLEKHWADKHESVVDEFECGALNEGESVGLYDGFSQTGLVHSLCRADIHFWWVLLSERLELHVRGLSILLALSGLANPCLLLWSGTQWNMEHNQLQAVPPPHSHNSTPRSQVYSILFKLYLYIITMFVLCMVLCIKIEVHANYFKWKTGFKQNRKYLFGIHAVQQLIHI